MKKHHRNISRAEAKERRMLKQIKATLEASCFNEKTGLNLSPEEYEKAKNDYSTDDPNEPPFFILLEQARAVGMEKEFIEGYKKVHGDIPHGEVIIGGASGIEERFLY